MFNKNMTMNVDDNPVDDRGNEKTDEVLLYSYAQGEMSAFELLYSRHKKALFNYLRRQCSDICIAEELAHDVWLAVIRQASLFEPTALFKTWLYRIAHNRLVDHWRKSSYSKQVLVDDLTQVFELQDIGLQGSELQNSVHRHSDLSSQDRSSELIEIEQILDAVSALSAEQTNAVLLKIEGFSYAEIAQITHSKPETVKSRLRYATKHLRLSMEVS